MYYHIPHAIDNIAKWYDSAPDREESQVKYWHYLGWETDSQVTRLMKEFDIEILRVTGQPYSDAWEMFADIENGQLQVSIDNLEHPVFDLETNFNFRVWHDLAHYEARSDFSYYGEVRAYEMQLGHIAEFAELPYYGLRHALFVEVLGQAASRIANGKFNTQKVF